MNGASLSLFVQMHLTEWDRDLSCELLSCGLLSHTASVFRELYFMPLHHNLLQPCSAVGHPLASFFFSYKQAVAVTTTFSHAHKLPGIKIHKQWKD